MTNIFKNKPFLMNYFIHILSLNILLTSVIFYAQGPKNYSTIRTISKGAGKKIGSSVQSNDDKYVDLLIDQINRSHEITPCFVRSSYEDGFYFGGLEYLNYRDDDNRLNKNNIRYDDHFIEQASSLTTMRDLLQLLKQKSVIPTEPTHLDATTHAALKDLSLTTIQLATIIKNGDIDIHISNKHAKKAIIKKEISLSKLAKNLTGLIEASYADKS